MQFLAVLLLACGIFSLAHCKDCKKALGMESGAIKDDQLTASSQFGERNAPSRARLNIKPALNKAGAWSPEPDDKTPWLQIDLKSRIIKVTRVATQGREDNVQWVTKYKLQYSNSGSNFKTYKEEGQDKIFLGNNDQNTVVSHNLSQPIRARFIRFLPISEFTFKSMRVEIYGCNETFQCPVCHDTGVEAELHCYRNAKFEICNRNNAVCQLTKAATAGNMQLEVTRKCTDMKSFMEEKEKCRGNPNCLHTTSCNTSRCKVTAPIAFQCQSCSHAFGEKAECAGFVTYKVCTEAMPACFVTQQLRGSFIQVSRGCGSKVEYERARFACRQGPENCPLIGRCDKNRCQAALPYVCGKSQKYVATTSMWTNEYLFRLWATLCMENRFLFTMM